MRLTIFLVSTALVLLVFGCGGSAKPHESEPGWEPLTVSRELQLRKWVGSARAAKGCFSPLPPAQWEQLRRFAGQDGHGSVPDGYRVQPVEGLGEVLLERQLVHGGGVFAFRRSADPRGEQDGSAPSPTPSPARWIVEVPHSFFDRHTLPIGWGVFAALDATALLTNTVHRYRGSNCDPGDDACASDMARSHRSAFHAIHRGLTEVEGGAARPDVVVVALHGFRQRHTDPDVIVSAAGTNTDVLAVQYALRTSLSSFGLEIAAYPDDIQRLGGEGSVQGRHLHAIGGSLVHLELADSVRESLWDSDGFHYALAEGLKQAFHGTD